MNTEPEDRDEQSDVLFLQMEKVLHEMLSRDIEKQKLEAQASASATDEASKTPTDD